MKVCSACKELKPLSEFYRWKLGKDGHRASCKNCVNCQNNSSLKKNPESKLRASRKYKKVNSEKVKEQTSTYRNSNPVKYAAHIAVQIAVREHRLVQRPCEYCGDVKTVAHHDDYSKPLVVRWLCNFHHKQWHTSNGEGLNGK